MTLKGRRILVLGAGRGLGIALAEACRTAGADVAAHTGRRGDFAVDLAAPAAVARLMAGARERIGGVDGLVNAAALQDMTADDDPADWERLLSVNVTAAVTMARAVMEGAASGAVVNIASVETVRPLDGHSAYAASKAALLSATRSLANAGAARGWRVNAVLPGLIDRVGLAEDWPDGVRSWCRAAPMGRAVTAQEVAAAAVFLLSDAASGITGAALPVDGGFLAAPAW